MNLQESIRKAYELYWRGSKDGEKSLSNAEACMNFFGTQTRELDWTHLKIQETLQGYAQWMKKKGLSNGTVNRRVSALRTALKAGGVSTEWSPLKEAKPRQEVLTARQEVDLLVGAEHRHGRAYRELLEFLLDTGCRLSEALSLRWADFHSVGDNARVSFRDTKNGCDRHVPLTQRAKAAVWAAQSLDATFDTVGPFSSWTVSRIDHKFRELGLRADLVPHSLRHTCATRLVERGVPLNVVQKWMGHKSIAVTMRYAHASDDGLMAAAKTLEKL